MKYKTAFLYIVSGILLSIIVTFVSPLENGTLAQVKCDHTLPPSADELTQTVNGQTVQPGDTVCLPAGSRNDLKIENLNGSAGRPITIINDGGVVTINANENQGIFIKGSSFLHLTGTGVVDKCGAAVGFSEQQCGIVVNSKSHGISTDHNVTNLHFSNIEISGGIVGMNLVQIDTGPDRDYSDALVTKMYVHDTSRDGLYLGKNYFGGATPWINDLEASYNLMANTGWQGMGVKSVKNANIHHNRTFNTGGADTVRAQGHQGGLNTGVNDHQMVATITNNCVDGATGYGVNANNEFTTIQDNVIINSGIGPIKVWAGGTDIANNRTDGTCDLVGLSGEPGPPGRPGEPGSGGGAGGGGGSGTESEDDEEVAERNADNDVNGTENEIAGPGALFDETNDVEGYIHPGIDIVPSQENSNANYVYSTHAGFVTYAGPAPPSVAEKGWMVQIESDLNRDNVADVITRYTHLFEDTISLNDFKYKRITWTPNCFMSLGECLADILGLTNVDSTLEKLPYGYGPYVARNQLLGVVGDTGSPGHRHIQYEIVTNRYIDTFGAGLDTYSCLDDPYLEACGSDPSRPGFFFPINRGTEDFVRGPVYTNPGLTTPPPAPTPITFE